MVNKRGFLRILEAIIAIIIVLGFVISIMPDKVQNTGKIPPDLEQTTESILKEVQGNPSYRECVLGDTNKKYKLNFNVDVEGGPKCVYKYIQYLSYPETTHPWNYAVRLCNINSSASITGCDYNLDGINGIDWKEKNNKFTETFPKDRDIYLKETTITLPDVSGNDIKIKSLSDYKLLTIYAWSKY